VDSALTCKRTYGYIKLGTNNYYSISCKRINESYSILSYCSTGSLTSDGNLCLGGSLEGVLASTSNTYIIQNPLGSVFESTSEVNILIYSDANSYVFQNIVDSKFLLLF